MERKDEHHRVSPAAAETAPFAVALPVDNEDIQPPEQIPSSVNDADTDMNNSRWKTFACTSQLHELVGKRGVLVLGNMGAGKSTTIAIQQGASFQLDKTSFKISYKLKRAPTSVPRISSGYVSQTLNIGVYLDPVSGIAYFDTAGLSEDRNADYAEWTRFSTSTALSVLDQILATLVVIDTQTLWIERGKGIRDIARNIAEIVGRGQSRKYFYDNMLFVFTNSISSTGIEYSVSVIQGIASEVLQSQYDLRQKKFKTLASQYPLSHTEYMQRYVGTGGFPPVETKINWSLVPDVDKTELSTIASTIELLKTITDNPARCFVSNPDGKNACNMQREALLKMILKGCSNIDKEQLNEIVNSRETSRHEVTKKLVKLANIFAQDVKDLASNYSRVIEEHENNITIMQQIEKQWERVKEKRTQRCVEELAICVNAEKEADKRVRYLEESTTLKILYKKEVRKVRSSSLFSWTILGYGYAVDDFQHSGDWFESSKLNGTNFQATDKIEDPKEGTLTVSLESSQGFDLRVDVDIYRQEKDLPATKDRVKLLKNEKKALSELKEILNTKRLVLEGIDSKEGMTEFELQAAKKPKRKIESIMGRLINATVDYRIAGHSCSNEEQIARDYDAMVGVLRLLELLEESDQISEAMDTGSFDTVKEILKSYDFIKKSQHLIDKTPTLQNIFGDSIREKADDTGTKFREDIPQKLPFFDKDNFLNAASEAKGKVLSIMSFVSTVSSTLVVVTKGKPIPCSIAMLSCWAYYGVTPMMWPLLFFGVFFLVYGIERRLEIVTSTFREDTKFAFDGVRQELQNMAASGCDQGLVLKEDVLQTIDKLLEMVLNNPHQNAMRSPFLSLLKDVLPATIVKYFKS